MDAVALAVSVRELLPTSARKYMGICTVCSTRIALPLSGAEHASPWFCRVVRHSIFGYPETILTPGSVEYALRFPVTELYCVATVTAVDEGSACAPASADASVEACSCS